MKVCKLKPDYNICCECTDNQIKNGLHLNCLNCQKCDTTYYPVIKEGKNFFGKYVVINRNGENVKVKMNRVLDIKESMNKVK